MPSKSGIAIFLRREEFRVVLALRMPGADTPAYPRVSGGCAAAHHVLMASSTWQVHRQVTALAAADLPLHELGVELSAALHGLVPHEGYCLIGFDPVSGLRAFQTARDALGRPRRAWCITKQWSMTCTGSPTWPAGLIPSGRSAAAVQARRTARGCTKCSARKDSAANCAWRSAAAAPCGVPWCCSANTAGPRSATRRPPPPRRSPSRSPGPSNESACGRAGSHHRRCHPAWSSSARTTPPRPSAPRRPPGSAICTSADS